MSPGTAQKAIVAAELRARAAECRALARMMSLRQDREMLLERAGEYEAQARRLEEPKAGGPG